MVMNDKHLQAFKEGKIRSVVERDAEGRAANVIGFIIETGNIADMTEQVKSVVEKFYGFKPDVVERLPYANYAVHGSDNTAVVKVGLYYLTNPFTQPIVETETLLTIDTGTSVLYLDITRGGEHVEDIYSVYKDEHCLYNTNSYASSLKYLIDQLPSMDLVVKQNNIS